MNFEYWYINNCMVCILQGDEEDEEDDDDGKTEEEKIDEIMQ